MRQHKLQMVVITLDIRSIRILRKHRWIRNTINHASEEDYDISSKDIISRIKNLIRAVENKHWDKITVMDELKEIIDFSAEK